MNEQPKMKDEGKNSVKKVFDNFKKPNIETKLGLDFADPRFAGRKLLRWVVPILLGLFALCCIIYAVIVWRVPLGLRHVEKNNNQLVEFDQRLFNESKSLTRATDSSTLRGVLTKSSSKEDVGLSTTISSIDRATSALSLTVTSSHEYRTEFATVYESTDESSQATIMESISNDETEIDTKVCSQIDIGSNKVMEERVQGFLGNYVAAGLLRKHIVYKNPNTGSFLFYHNEGQLRINSKDYPINWVISHLDYLAIDVKCNDDIAITSDCISEWFICTLNKYDGLRSKLYNCTKNEGIIYQCKNDDVEVNLEEDDAVCHELELLSTDGIAKVLPETMGIYLLEDNLDNDKIVYVHKEMDFYLSYDSTLNATMLLDAYYDAPFTGAWVIESKTDLLLYNKYCTNADFPANGKCELGWSYPFNESFYDVDWSAKAICRNPSPVVTTVPADSVCKTFELTSNIALETEWLVFLLGEYTIVEETYNEKAVYRKRYPFEGLYFKLYFEYNEFGNAWVVALEIDSVTRFLYNGFCSNLEDTLNENCDSGWFYVNQKSKKWDYDSSMSLHCTEYVQDIKRCDRLKEGRYEHKPARRPGHYVEITMMPDGNYRWKNRADWEWTLISNGEACNQQEGGQVLQVGTDCPYYNWPSKNFYTSAQWNQTGIYGPFNMFYHYQGGL